MAGITISHTTEGASEIELVVNVDSAPAAVGMGVTGAAAALTAVVVSGTDRTGKAGRSAKAGG